ncbi:Nitrogenase iron-iron, accessory protein AnfO [Syntrophomonas zehnderi OL-4]|uniref:Nitrogenase iron-iron, accessory protein AnfO n=1 Tax=Syntrophomonas zehnderi OL-4 TaxID=690567 RepID=A0A0E4GC36_9FIRM|nr:Fe-only nitrogenase accessory AnfO family protein [Syntrophomonas zehnderi]CFX69924.1 Nitrogenase iron-iron, accessory protein AnfO [Syntrophomonas zehnderi OL-4]
MEIAVLIGADGTAAPIQTAEEIQVFKYDGFSWELSRRMLYNLQAIQGLKAMREYMDRIISFLNGCRILAGSAVVGLPFYELEKAGFTVWEMTGHPADIIAHIMAAETQTEVPRQLNDPSIPEAAETSHGCYSISLKDIQNRNTKITSKQILFPLLKNEQVRNLEIICSHIPPWLEIKLISGELEGTIEKITSNEFRVTIHR